MDAECAAQALEKDADYRILRRFKPRRYYGDIPPPADRLGYGVVVDTETTGKDPSVDRLVELALVRFSFDREEGRIHEVLDIYEGFDDPGIPIDPQASRVNGITDEMVKGQKLDEGRIASALQGAEIAIAHHAAFDREVCERRLPLFAEFFWACSLTQIDWNTELISSQKLDYLAYRFGFFYEAHRADADSLALLEILSQTLPVAGETGLKQILRIYQKQELHLWATGSPFEKKGLLSARGYRWSDGSNDKPKAWHTTLPAEKLLEERAWLKANIYGYSARVVVDTVDARCRFSARRLDTRELHL